jgi:hypothetical protein
MNNVTKTLEVQKTQKEKRLNLVYMGWLKSIDLIPNTVVIRFKKDVEEVRKENPIYNKN